jgi:bifunctional NMN adenylyltransferase/nudix hydrolase
MTPTPPGIAVLVGRFQPFHNAHLALLRRALQVAPRCVVVIGSAHQARTPKNPFTWSERAEMVRLALPESERGRVSFLPVRDYYDQARWVRVVSAAIAAIDPSARVALVGHFKDATSEYLRGFPGWSLVSVERMPGAGGTQVREALFAGDPHQLDATLGALIDQVPPTTIAFLRAWGALPFVAALTNEWAMLRAYHDAWASAPYPPVFVTVDAVVRCADQVLLIQRGRAPGVGLFAVPGGFIEQRETAYQSAVRELAEETHLELLAGTMQRALRASAVFDHPDRSLRGRTITHAHYFDLGERELPEVRADDDAQSVAWVPIADIPALENRFHDDHFHMLDHFIGLTEEGLAA